MERRNKIELVHPASQRLTQRNEAIKFTLTHIFISLPHVCQPDSAFNAVLKAKCTSLL